MPGGEIYTRKGLLNMFSPIKTQGLGPGNLFMERSVVLYSVDLSQKHLNLNLSQQVTKTRK